MSRSSASSCVPGIVERTRIPEGVIDDLGLAARGDVADDSLALEDPVRL